MPVVVRDVSPVAVSKAELRAQMLAVINDRAIAAAGTAARELAEDVKRMNKPIWTWEGRNAARVVYEQQEAQDAVQGPQVVIATTMLTSIPDAEVIASPPAPGRERGDD